MGDLKSFVTSAASAAKTPIAKTPVAKNNRARSADIHVKNFGCRLNAYEGALIKERLTTLSENPAVNNCVVINSCAVTSEAEKQVRREIRRSRKKYPDHKIIVTGCAAQINPQAYGAMAEVDAVVGNDVKHDAASYDFLHNGKASEHFIGGDIMAARETSTERYGAMIAPPQERVRAHLEIQNGCDHRCSFCIIPYGRGAARSLPPTEALRQVEALAKAGVREITLSGVDITCYGDEWGNEGGEGGESGESAIGLGDLLRRLCRNFPHMTWRLSSLDGAELDEAFFASFAEFSQIHPHLHLSLQSGNDLILKRMKRRHSRDEALALMTQLRKARPETVFGGDFICGFPTESEEMFADTLAFIEAADMVWLHVFPFSPRHGTPAERMPQVAPQVVKQRARRMQALGRARAMAYMKSLVGTEMCVLAHADGSAYSPTYAPIKFTTPEIIGGEFYKVRIIACENYADVPYLSAEICDGAI